MNEPTLLQRLERYLDAAPRSAAGVESMGAITLFTQIGAGWPYYARPTLGWPAPVSTADIETVRRRQREKRLPEAFEWVHENTPSMRNAVESSGLSVEALPLMVLAAAPAVLAATPPAGVQVRMVAAEDPLLNVANAVADVAFSTSDGPAGERAAGGVAERDAVAAATTPAREAFARGRLRRGLTFAAVAEEPGIGPVCVGSHQPVGAVTEITGVGTLPGARRRGLAAAVTARLVVDALERGVTTVFLSAGSDDVARMYARLGFVRVGTSCLAAVGPG